MNRTRRLSTISRLACTLAGLATALLATAAAAPAAFARPAPPFLGHSAVEHAIAPAGDATVPPPPVHTVIIGGTPGWQIALIAIAAAAVAATVTVLLGQARAARRHQPYPAPNPR